MALLTVHVHTRKDNIDTRNRVGDPIPDLTKDLCGNRYDIHDRIRPAVMITRPDDLNVDLFDMLLRRNKLINHLFTDCHMAVCRDIVMVAPLYFTHVESLDHKLSQVLYFICQI